MNEHDRGAPAGVGSELPFSDQGLVFRQSAEERNRGSAGLGGWLSAFASLFTGQRYSEPES